MSSSSPSDPAAQRVPSALLWTAVGCTLASVTISFWSILRHLYSYQRPALQRLVIRIMRPPHPLCFWSSRARS